MDYLAVKQFFDSIKDMPVLIIGDVMIDAYLWGKVERISPEAPVPVVAVQHRESRPGGAANVAVNVKSLGAIPYICSVLGNDHAGSEFLDILKQNQMPSEGVITSPKRKTTIKTRVIGNNHQLLRVDAEEVIALSIEEEQLLINKVVGMMDTVKPVVIIFEDYDKGVITKNVIDSLIAEARQRAIPVTVDPKKNNFHHYHHVTLFKPNLKELKEGLKIDIENLSAEELFQKTQSFASSQNISNLLITLSEHGMYYASSTQRAIIPAHLRNISDVSGAGDTVISVASLAIGAGLSLEQVAALSNLAGGLVCEKVGVVPIDPEQLLQEVKRISVL